MGSIDPVAGLVNGGFLVATPVAWWAGERSTQRAAGRSSPRTTPRWRRSPGWSIALPRT